MDKTIDTEDGTTLFVSGVGSAGVYLCASNSNARFCFTLTTSEVIELADAIELALVAERNRVAA